MATTLHIRDVPTVVHDTLVARAQARGVSLRCYAIDVLEKHCALPTMDEWLTGLARLQPILGGASGADAVRRARAEDDSELARAGDRR